MDDERTHFVHVDHLNTPRLVANAAGIDVWRWDQQEPFGVSPADENPSGLGVFKFPLRHGGWQYADDETGEFWNWMRTYSTITGRFDQSDPIGLGGGLNTYLYGNGDPLRYVDPRGEAAAGIVIVGGAALIVGTAIYMSSPAKRRQAKASLRKSRIFAPQVRRIHVINSRKTRRRSAGGITAACLGRATSVTVAAWNEPGLAVISVVVVCRCPPNGVTPT